MPTKIPYFTKLSRDVREAMRRYKAVVGVPEAQQIDRALREWLDDKPEAWAPVPKRRVLFHVRARKKAR
jgi:hypothetical protein